MGVTKKNSNQAIKRRHAKGITQSGGKAHQNQAHADDEIDDPRARIWLIVAMIPASKAASYGQIARLAGMPSHARFVGATLRNLPKGTKLPWFRVVQSTRTIAPRGGAGDHQRKLLEADGVTFIGGKIVKADMWEADTR